MAENFSKQENYKGLIKRYDQAFKRGFYLETVAITYALIEDRLTSALNKLEIVSVDIEGKPRLKSVISKFSEEIVGKRYKKVVLRKITDKFLFLKSCLEFCKNEKSQILEKIPDKAFFEIYSKCKRINVEKHFFEDFEEWKNERNKLVHDLSNFKSSIEMKETAKRCSKMGYSLFRILDNEICRKFRKGGTIK